MAHHITRTQVFHPATVVTMAVSGIGRNRHQEGLSRTSAAHHNYDRKNHKVNSHQRTTFEGDIVVTRKAQSHWFSVKTVRQGKSRVFYFAPDARVTLDLGHGLLWAGTLAEWWAGMDKAQEREAQVQSIMDLLR